MKHSFKLAAAALALAVAAASCSRKEAAAPAPEAYGVSEADSTAILSSTDAIMEKLQAGDVDAAAAMMYRFNPSDSTVSPLAQEDVDALRNRQRFFPVLRYNVKQADFSDPYSNAVVYNVEFGEPSPETGKAPTTKMAFNIVNIDGQYFATIMDK